MADGTPTITLAGFFELLEGSENLVGTEALAMIREDSPEASWEVARTTQLTEEVLTGLLGTIRRGIREQYRHFETEAGYEMLGQEGDGFIAEVVDKARLYGIELDVAEEVGEPITLLDHAVSAGVVQVVDGMVHPVDPDS